MPVPPGATARRVSRAEAKAETRQRLIEAAAVVFARKGYAGAGVDELAGAAGLTIGALYSHFGDKEGLFLAVLEQDHARHVADLTAIASKQTTGQALGKQLASYFERVATRHGDWCLLSYEFWLFAARNPRIAQRLARRWEQPRVQIAAFIDQVGGFGESRSAEAAAVVIALLDGLMLQRLVEPQPANGRLFAQALDWLFTGLSAQGPNRRSGGR